MSTTSADTDDRAPAGYQSDWALFTDWCAATGTPPRPAAVDTVRAFLAGCPAAPAAAARRVAALLWHYRHSPTAAAAAGLPERREVLGLPPVAGPRPLPDPDAVAAAVRALPTTGWTGGFFGRRDAALLTLAATPLSWTALAGLRTGEVTVTDGVLHLPGGHELSADADPRRCPPCAWLRWARALGLARREPSIRVLRAALDRAAPLTGTSLHRCEVLAASNPAGDGPGNPVFVPIDQHGYPALHRALAPTSLARLVKRHLDGRPPFRRVIAPTPRPAEPREPPAAPAPPPLAAPSATALQAAHRHRLAQRRDDLRQLEALDRLLDDLERRAEHANDQVAALAGPSS